MQANLEMPLWEDLLDVKLKSQKALDALHALERAIKEGRIRDPNHQDSSRLNRLVVLAELLYSEVHPWIDELGVNHQPSAAPSARKDALG
jgi:hypothetical protein